MPMITRQDADALIEAQVANEIFTAVTAESKALSLFRRLPNMTSDKTKLRILDSLPVAGFVDESKNNGRKPVTKLAWENKFINAEEIAVIIPIKENVLNDADRDIWAEIKPLIATEFGRIIDDAIFNGKGAPKSWGNGIIADIISAGAEVTATGDLYSDINDTMVKVEESGYDVNALLGGTSLKGKFRMMVDKNGQPLNTTEIGSLRREFMKNGAWDKTKSILIAGDFSQAVYAMRQDITYKVLTEGVIQDPSTGEILYNLGQDDMVALRIVLRMGYSIPNPVNFENSTETRFPFANLKPAVI